MRTRTNALMVLLTDAEKAIIRDKAESAGMSMSVYARVVLLKDARKEEE